MDVPSPPTLELTQHVFAQVDDNPFAKLLVKNYPYCATPSNRIPLHTRAILPFLPVPGNHSRPSSPRLHTQTQTKFYGLKQALTMLCRSPPSSKTTLVGCLAILHPTYHTFHTYLFGYQTQPTLAPSSNPLWSTRQLNRAQDQSSIDPLVYHHCRVTPSS